MKTIRARERSAKVHFESFPDPLQIAKKCANSISACPGREEPVWALSIASMPVHLHQNHQLSWANCTKFKILQVLHYNYLL